MSDDTGEYGIFKGTEWAAMNQFKEELKKEILAELRQENDPEPVREYEFWPGQIVEVRDIGEDGYEDWSIERYLHPSPKSGYKHSCEAEDYNICRPAKNVAQWRPVPDDCMEMPEWAEGENVILKFYRGEVNHWRGLAEGDWKWDRPVDAIDRIIAVMVIPEYEVDE